MFKTIKIFKKITMAVSITVSMAVSMAVSMTVAVSMAVAVYQRLWLCVNGCGCVAVSICRDPGPAAHPGTGSDTPPDRGWLPDCHCHCHCH
jgi:hypothetical protein